MAKKNSDRKETQTGLEQMRDEIDKAFKNNSTIGGDNNFLLHTKIEFDSDGIGTNEFQRVNDYF